MHEQIQIGLPNHGDGLIEVDAEFAALLCEMNLAGLRTTDHCAGDRDDASDSYLAIDMAECDVWVRQMGDGVRLVIRWNRYGRKLYGHEPNKATRKD